MANPETLGDRLRERMKARKLKNKQVAAAVGVHPGTVSYWLANTQVPDDETLAPVAELLDTTVAYLRYGYEPATAIAAQPAHGVRETAVRYGEETPAWPQEARVFVQRFLLEATELGANDQELDFLRRALTSPEAYVMYHGGRKREMTPDEMRLEMEGLGAGLRKWLEIKLQRRRRAEHQAGA